VITIDFNRLDIRSGDRILDIGCGSGRHVCEAARCDNVMTIGVDLCFNDLLKARERMDYHHRVGAHGGGPFGLMTASITRLPFQADSFDLVICSEVLEHIPDHEQAVMELLRVTKPGANLVLSVPRAWPERICWALSDQYHLANGGHVRIYKRRNLIDLVERSGAKKRGEHHAHGLHSPYWWLKCLLGPTRDDAPLVNLYHDLLVWDMMKKPRLTRLLDTLLTPIMGKSLVLYFKKQH
jgi:SAM-dependent methyltransferase